jgi:hypothetical protein
MSRENLTLKEKNEILQKAVFDQRKLIEKLETEVEEWKTVANTHIALAKSYQKEIQETEENDKMKY